MHRIEIKEIIETWKKCGESYSEAARLLGIDRRTVKHWIELGRQSHKRRRPLFQNGRAMRPENTPALGYLQMDVKHVTPELSGLSYTCFEYAAIDILSRYKVALLLPVLDEAGALVLLQWAIQTCPFPVRYIQTDNGLEFQRGFHEKCQGMGNEHFYIHKNSPRENAVVERSFRTDEDEFFLLLAMEPEDINELNKWFQKYLTTL